MIPFMNPAWSGWIILFKTVSRRRARALESILLAQQTRLTGQYESYFVGSLPFLRRTDITACDKVGGRDPRRNASAYTSRSTGVILLANFL